MLNLPLILLIRLVASASSSDHATQEAAAYAEGLAYFKNGEYPQAIKTLEAALEHNPKNAAKMHLHIGLSYYKIKKYAETCKAYQFAHLAGEHSFSLHYNHGLALYQQDRYKETIRSFLKAFEADLEHAKKHFNILHKLGLAYTMKHPRDWQLAILVYEDALSVAGTSEEEQKAKECLVYAQNKLISHGIHPGSLSLKPYAYLPASLALRVNRPDQPEFPHFTTLSSQVVCPHHLGHTKRCKSKRRSQSRTQRLRQELKKEKKEEIKKMHLEWFGNKCPFCGRDDPDTIEHLDSLANGGDNSPWNLAYSCELCNQMKNDMNVWDWYRAENPAVEEIFTKERADLLHQYQRNHGLQEDN